MIFIAIDGGLAAIMAITDPIKESTPAALKTLHDLGLRVVMLTGDAHPTAKAVAEKLGIDEFHAGVSPQDKHDFVKRLKDEGKDDPQGVPDNPNHAGIGGFPAAKEDQLSLAEKLAAKATDCQAPPE